MGVKVSVVVAVFDPAREEDAFDACVRSLLDQSLPPDEYEVIVVDCGVAEPLRRRLDALAAVRPNVRVLPMERPGSVAAGRNLGLSVACGEYVYVLGQTDRLAPEALRRMHELAVTADAQVVVGRLARDGRPPMAAFGRTRFRADLLEDRLFALLTCHKLVRRDFAEERRLHFPELTADLSEQGFSVRAYLAAETVAILADQVCCHLGPRPPAPVEPGPYLVGLRWILDAVDAAVAPGQLRDRLYAHLLDGGVLRPLGGRRLLALPSGAREELFAGLRDLVRERFPARLDRWLPVHLRIRATLVRAGRLDRLLAFTRGARGIDLHAELRDLRWDGPVLTVALTAELRRGDGSPLWFEVAGERVHWLPPVGGLRLPPEARDATDVLDRARLVVHLHHEETGMSYPLPTVSTVEWRRDAGRARIWMAGQARLDLATAACGDRLPAGPWAVYVALDGGVHQAMARVTRPASPPNCPGAAVGDPPRLVVPSWSDRGELGLCVEPRSFAESIAMASPGATVTRRDGHLFIVVPVPYVPPSGGPPLELVLRHEDAAGGRTVTVPALAEPGMPGRLAGQLVAKVPVRRLPVAGCLNAGSWLPALRADGQEVRLRFRLRVTRTGQVVVGPGSAQDGPSLLTRLVVRLPGGRHAARLASAVQRRWAS